MFLTIKAPTEVVERRWTVPVDSDDAPASVSLSASGITVDSNEFQGNELVLTLSGGTNAVTGSIAATVTTDQGRVLVETLYIPVAVTTSDAQTVNDIVAFALRKVVGLGETASADEADDARERLEDMLTLWRQTGADIGAPERLELTSVLYCPNWALQAVKNGLVVQVAEFYGAEVSGVMFENARRGLQQIKASQLPVTRAAAEYF